MNVMRGLLFTIVLTSAWLGLAGPVSAQLAPEIGYMFPPGAAAGTTVDVRLGGYDWTPDMQLFVLDPRVKLEITGPGSEVLVAEPPYWFGAKGRGPAFPQPREFPARLTIPAGFPPGTVVWQVANANGTGAAAIGKFVVGDLPEIVEDRLRTGPQLLSALPVTVSGQIHKIEEIDRYRFSVPKTGPITCELNARRFGSPLNGVMKVHDAAGRLIAEAFDTEGVDTAITFVAQAGTEYIVSLHDLDFRGDRSYVYRLSVNPAPRVLATIPAAGRRGATQPVEFIGLGVATGEAKLESVTQPVTFPADPQAAAFDYRLETPFGKASSVSILLSDLPETLEPVQPEPEARRLAVPAAVTGVLEARYGVDRYLIDAKKGDALSILAESRGVGSALDLSLSLVGPDGKEVANNDDLPSTTNAGLQFTASADGAYQVLVSDTSGKSGHRAAIYRLVVTRPAAGFTLSAPQFANVVIDGKAPLVVKAVRDANSKEPISLTISGLPAGVTANVMPPATLVIPEGKSELSIELKCAPDAAAFASLATIQGTATVGGQAITRNAGPMLVATVMKPRCALTPEGLDDVRKWQRGSTFPAPVLIERLEGYQGEVKLEMTSKGERHRQGIYGPELVVPPGVQRIEYPVFLPEWLETTKTSRIVLNGVVKVPDPKGNVRYLVNKMNMRIGFLPEGALLKLSHKPRDYQSRPGEPLRVDVSLTRALELKEPATLELKLGEALLGQLTAEPITLPAQQTEAVFPVTRVAASQLSGEREITIRATVMKGGKLPVISETTVLVNFLPAK